MLMTKTLVEVVGLLNMVVEVESGLIRYHDQWLVEGAARRISSTSRDCGTNTSDHKMRRMV
jgi:hypothetical protein